ncbi:MAG: hypothetical protein DI551_03540 [Micavibrio aeruginosavorus]|uniref:Uncharacterized protein n=1 Tax=Micavibrio aeruginosavorus TaxID=349221 RepID=A0A2W5N4U9_9BACT|nr:MAG: hypothetical protein DI551_03540 [Micavibrio aeruginosavorus]
MDLKDIQEKLKELRDRIKDEGRISAESEAALKNLLSNTLVTANDEIENIQNRLSATLAMRAGNDNDLTPEQKKRLRIIEKTGTGSTAVH